MGYVSTKGILIREVNIGEADKIVTIFSKDYGKLQASARGARRPKSKLVAGMQFLCYSDYMLFSGKNMYSMNSCDVIESFYDIRNDVVTLTYAAHITDIINDAVQENQPAPRVLRLFLNTLHMLTKPEKNPELITRIFEIKLLSILGYAPYVKGCLVCGNEDSSCLAFSFKKCGFLCDHCINEDVFAEVLSTGAARTINHIVYSRLENLFGFNVAQPVLDELSMVSRRYLRERLEKNYTKLDFLKSLDKTFCDLQNSQGI